MKTIVKKNVEIQQDYLYSITYCLFESIQYIDSLGEKMTYGIQVQKRINNNADLEETIVQDVCSQSEAAMSLFNTILEHNVFPVHLRDVIVDYLS